jgi:hypothetical protein
MKPRKMLKPAKLAYVAAPRAGNWSPMAVPRKSRMAGLGIELGRHEFQSAMGARV